MSESACLRSMAETLVAAVSSFALFLAANWGTPDFLGEFLPHIAFPFAIPLLTLYKSVENALKVYTVKKSCLVKKMDHPSITIMTLCPIFIQFPTSALASAPDSDAEISKLHQRGYESRTHEEHLKNKCPLELRPARPDSVDAASKVNTNLTHTTAHVNEEVICLELPEQCLDERALLLNLGLAPKDNELSYVRSRNRFQSVVTALQAIGYMLTVIQRAAQHLAISPVEAFVTFLCIIVGLQLLIELYACGHYQRPLLLHLNAQQLHSLLHNAVPLREYSEGEYKKWIPMLVTVFTSVVVLGLSMYYFAHYVHAHLICSLSALLFFLAQLLSASMFLPLQMDCGILNSESYIFILGPFLFILYHLMYSSSLIVAVVSTIVDWKAFQEASQKVWYAWLLPHVSS